MIELRCIGCYSLMEFWDKIIIFDTEPEEMIKQSIYKCPNCGKSKTVDD